MAPRTRLKYASWVQSVLGDPLPPARWAYNHAAGAIESTSYDFFRRCFENRLLRLKKAFGSDRRDYALILKKLSAVGTASWSGPYAELAAYDFLTSFTKVIPEVKPGERTLSARIGGQTPILDGKLPSYFDLHFDVKRLGDVTREILAGVFSKLEKKFPDVQFAAEFPQHIDPAEIGKQHAAISRGLQAALARGESGFSLPKVGLCVRIYKPRRSVVTTLHHHDRYQQANAWKYTAIEDAHQLLEDRPNLRIFVTHPWYDQTNSTDFSGGRTTFFRSVSRRVFCELTKDERPSDQVLPRGGAASVTVAEIAKRVSAILFIVDETVEPKLPKADPTRPGHVMSGFLYVNPNANAKPEANLVIERLCADANSRRLLQVFDDFECDNY
jgi:hypothetical protein